MVDQLNGFASEVTRVEARSRHRRKAWRPGTGAGRAATWKDLTDNVNFMASNLTAQVRNIADVATAIAGATCQEDHSERQRRDSAAQENHQHDGGPVERLRRRVTRVGARGRSVSRLRWPANVLGVAGTWKDLTDSVNSMAST